MQNGSSSTPKVSSISRRFSYALIGVVTVVLIAFATAAILLDITMSESELEMRLDDAIHLAQMSLATPLWNLDKETVDDFVRALLLDKSIVYVKVLWALPRQSDFSAESQIISERKRQKYEEKDFTYHSKLKKRN